MSILLNHYIRSARPLTAPHLDMNQYIHTYALARAAYDTVKEKIDLELKADREYREAFSQMTEELLEVNEPEFDRLSKFVIEKESAMDSRYRRWELFDCLVTAENLLIHEYADFIKKRQDMPKEVLSLFESDLFQSIMSCRIERNKLIRIILVTPDFDMVAN